MGDSERKPLLQGGGGHTGNYTDNTAAVTAPDADDLHELGDGECDRSLNLHTSIALCLCLRYHDCFTKKTLTDRNRIGQ